MGGRRFIQDGGFGEIVQGQQRRAGKSGARGDSEASGTIAGE